MTVSLVGTTTGLFSSPPVAGLQSGDMLIMVAPKKTFSPASTGWIAVPSGSQWQWKIAGPSEPALPDPGVPFGVIALRGVTTVITNSAVVRVVPPPADGFVTVPSTSYPSSGPVYQLVAWAATADELELQSAYTILWEAKGSDFASSWGFAGANRSSSPVPGASLQFNDARTGGEFVEALTLILDTEPISSSLYLG